MLARRLTALAILLAVAGACREKPRQQPPPAVEQEPGSAESSAAVPSAKPPDPARCREVKPGSLFAVGEAAPAREPAPDVADDEEQDEPIALPFAAELGGAAGLGGGFAVGVLESQKRGQRVSVALLGADGSGRLLEIGTVHGDVEPPALTAFGDRAVLLYGDSDAAGATLKSAVVGAKADKPVHGPELSLVERDAGAALTAIQDEILVAFSRAPKGKPQLLTARFRPAPGSAFSEPEPVAAQAAESPRLTQRPGGAWLGWIEQHPLPKAKKGPASDAGDEEPGGLELGPRSLRIVALDGAGKPLGAPLALTRDGSHVVAFEIAPWADGGAIVAWRDDKAAPGVEGGALHLAHVKPDGSSEAGELDDAEIGAGVPSLIADPAPRSPGQLVWLAAGGGNETTRFALLTGSGTSLTPLAGDKLLGTAELIAVHGGRLLAARPRRTARDLFLLECSVAP